MILVIAALAAMVILHLTKRHGGTVAVDDLILGLDAADSGSVTVGGRPYAAWRRPLLAAGALLEARAFHGGRTARDHLLCLALSNGIGRARVEEVLELTGLRGAARRRAGRFSLGMSQRLGIAAALLGDPPVLMLDVAALAAGFVLIGRRDA